MRRVWLTGRHTLAFLAACTAMKSAVQRSTGEDVFIHFSPFRRTATVRSTRVRPWSSICSKAPKAFRRATSSAHNTLLLRYQTLPPSGGFYCWESVKGYPDQPISMGGAADSQHNQLLWFGRMDNVLKDRRYPRHRQSPSLLRRSA